MTNTFEANGKIWTTDADTLKLLRDFRAAGNEEMVGMVFELGRKFGRIVD